MILGKNRKFFINLAIAFGFLTIIAAGIWVFLPDLIQIDYEPVITFVNCFITLLSLFLSFSYKSTERKSLNRIEKQIDDQIQTVLEENFGSNSKPFENLHKSLERKISCDRKYFVDKFTDNFLGSNEYPRHLNTLFIIHGEKIQRPRSLIERLCLILWEKYPGDVFWVSSAVKDSSTGHARMKFFEFPSREISKKTIEVFEYEYFPEILGVRGPLSNLESFRNSPKQNFKYIILPMFIEYRYWNNSTVKSLRYLIENFCKRIEGKQKLLFFLNIEWPSTSTRTLGSRKFRRRKNRIIHSINELEEKYTNNTVFCKKELGKVLYDDIEKSIRELVHDGVLLRQLCQTICARNEKDLQHALNIHGSIKKKDVNMDWVERATSRILNFGGISDSEARKEMGIY